MRGKKINSRDKTDLCRREKNCVISAFMRALNVAGDSFMSICSTLTINPQIKYGCQKKQFILYQKKKRFIDDVEQVSGELKKKEKSDVVYGRKN